MRTVTKEQWQAIKNRDKSFDGQFVYVNRNTGTICKPSCGKKVISPENIILFNDVEQALNAGYHVCKKCHPEFKDWKGARQELAESARQEILSHYQEAFSLDALADSLHINKFYLLRSFKQVTGETPLQYHNRIRCEKAGDLLQQVELPIAYIAFETGFNSASHFSRRFKEVTGMTPSEYRRSYLESLNS